jgi:hypothetical protein
MMYAFFWVNPRRGITQKKAYNNLKLAARVVWITVVSGEIPQRKHL